jgi:hypothetical protein
MQRILTLVVAFLTTAIVVTTATVHLRLTDSAPKKEQTVTEPPEEIRLWFSERTSLPVSRLGLRGPDGDISLGDIAATDDPKSFKAAVNDTLLPNTYTVTWRTAGDDGHILRGEFTFTIASADRR